jgi:hypothetical protein
MLLNICIFWNVTVDMKQHHNPEDLNIQQRHTFACFTTKIKKSHNWLMKCTMYLMDLLQI